MPSLFPEPAASASSSNDWVNAHCDGGARGNPGPAGYGAILQDDAGHTLAELSEYLGHRTNNFAEYAGLLGCLQWALDHGHRNLRVVSDSELMVKQIQGKYKVNSPDLRPLWEEARRRIAKLDGFQISHALRHKNKAADQLANDAMDRGTGKPAAGRPTPAPAPAPAPTKTVPSRSEPAASAAAVERPAASSPTPKSPPPMLRGFTRGNSIHLLGNVTLPDGLFVKIIPE
jgi:ribonuclease HI